MVGGSVLDIESSHLPCGDSGLSKDLSIHWGEFRPLKIGAINVKDVLLPSDSAEEDLSRSSSILFGIDVVGDIGADAYLFGDVVVDEGVGVRGLCRVIV